MLHILLCVLKWIGIILLSILLLILLILLAILFVPLRYKVKGRYEDKPDAAVTVSWLLHLVHVRVRYTDALFWQVRIFGIPFLDSRREKKEKPDKADKASDMERGDDIDDDIEDEIKDVSKSITDADAEEISKKPDAEVAKSDVPEETADFEETEESADKPKGFFAKLRQFVLAIFSTIAQVFRNIRYTIRKICDKIKHICENIGYYHGVITSDAGRETLSVIKRELGNLFKHIAPRKFKLDLTFGFDDPGTTGQVMGIVSMLYPIWNLDISLHPDFEKKVMAGQVYIRGRIRVFTLIRIAWRVYFNKNLKKVLVMLQKGGANHG